MKILKLIHGYPPTYNAGSEVYTQMLCQGLSAKHEVQVLTREEDPFAKPFSVRTSADALNSAIKLHLLNIPLEKFRYSYRNKQIDDYGDSLIKDFKPDVVHIGHLNHLSLSLVERIHQHRIPIVYTLHDYWLMCPRGQFIQRNPVDLDNWSVCDKQIDERCARNCYSGYFSGAKEDDEADVLAWTGWVNRRMSYVKKIADLVDVFIAPSKYLEQRFVNDFVIPSEKIIFLDYGFDLTRFNQAPDAELEKSAFTFGYIGTHIPAKGIQDLIVAFGDIQAEAKLIVWGRSRGCNTQALKAICAQLPLNKQKQIEWRDEYANENISQDVFRHIDCLVVPSIWVENSPLVIHEALQANVPVITADIGGMSEHIQHEVNGLLFEHRNTDSLSLQMQRLASQPELVKQLKHKRYLFSEDGNIPSIEAHVKAIESIYDIAIKRSTQ